MLKLFVFIFLLYGCGVAARSMESGPIPIESIEPQYVDSELVPFVNSYPTVVPTSIGITFGDTDGRAAFCYILRYGDTIIERKIVINRIGFWDKGSTEQRVQVVWHELNHCVGLSRTHNDHFTGGTPDSIMNSYAWSKKDIFLSKLTVNLNRDKITNQFLDLIINNLDSLEEAK